MKLLRQIIQTIPACDIQWRSLVHLAGLKYYLSREKKFAGLNEELAMRRSVNHPSPVTAPAEMKTKDNPSLLTETLVAHDQPGKVFMRCTSITVFEPVLANREDQALFLKLAVPSAGES